MITLKKLLEIDQLVASLYQKNPDLKEGKFGYGYKRFYEKNLTPNFKEYLTAQADIDIDNALVDEKTKAVLYNDDKTDYQYSKEGLKAARKAKDELWETWKIKEVEIEPYFMKEENLPELNEEERELLKGVLIENDTL